MSDESRPEQNENGEADQRHRHVEDHWDCRTHVPTSSGSGEAPDRAQDAKPGQKHHKDPARRILALARKSPERDSECKVQGPEKRAECRLHGQVHWPGLRKGLRFENAQIPRRARLKTRPSDQPGNLMSNVS